MTQKTHENRPKDAMHSIEDVLDQRLLEKRVIFLFNTIDANLAKTIIKQLWYLEFENNHFDFAVLNAKGFGGNNGTALVASPSKTMAMLQSKYSKDQIKKYHKQKEKIDHQLIENKNVILKGDTKSRYIFGENVIDGMNDFDVESHQITNKLNNEKFNLESNLPYQDFFEK